MEKCDSVRHAQSHLGSLLVRVDGAFSHSAMRTSLDGSIFFYRDVTDE